MSQHGGHRPGAGRKKGAARKTIEIAVKAASQGITPLEYLLGVLRSEDAEVTPAMKMDAAKSAAPYMHARLQSVEVSGKGGGPVETQTTVVTLDLARRVAFLLDKAGRQKGIGSGVGG